MSSTRKKRRRAKSLTETKSTIDSTTQTKSTPESSPPQPSEAPFIKPPLKHQKKGYKNLFTLTKSPIDYLTIDDFVSEKKDYYDYRIVGSIDGKFYIFHKKDLKPPAPTTEEEKIAQARAAFRSRQFNAEIVGWKLHVNVHPHDVEKAWELIHPILLKYKLDIFKIVKPTVLRTMRDNLGKLTTDEADSGAAILGKQITIYDQGDMSEADRIEFIKELETVLKGGNIRAGKVPDANCKIEGSAYLSYRNDTHPVSKKYISDFHAKLYAAQHEELKDSAHNLIKAKDPYQDLRPFAEKPATPRR